jgi:uncharacterized protein YegL
MEGMYANIEGIVRRQLFVFFLCDTSGSMIDRKISACNTVMRELIPELYNEFNEKVDLKVAVLEFSTGCRWLYPEPRSVDSIVWQNLEAAGSTDMGAMIIELNDKLSRKKFLKINAVATAPVLFLLSDGEATDDFDKGLACISQNTWYRNAIKIALAIGENANVTQLAKFTGNPELVLSTDTSPEKIKQWIRVCTMTASEIASGNSRLTKEGALITKQDMVIQELHARAEEQEEEADPVFD